MSLPYLSRIGGWTVTISLLVAVLATIISAIRQIVFGGAP